MASVLGLAGTFGFGFGDGESSLSTLGLAGTLGFGLGELETVVAVLDILKLKQYRHPELKKYNSFI